MLHKEVQGHFSQISEEWNRPTELVDKACTDAYNRVANLWGQYAHFVPQGFNFHANNDFFEASFGKTRVYLAKILKDHPELRIKDVDIPQKFISFLSKIADESEKGKSTILPGIRQPWVSLGLYGRWPVSSKDDRYGILPIEHDYTEWVRSVWNEQQTKPLKQTGWLAGVSDSERDLSFRFSNEGSLTAFGMTIDQPAAEDLKRTRGRQLNLRKLYTTASFRGGKLYSLRHEVPNGSLFPDPRGEIDSIWPSWVNDLGGYGFTSDLIRKVRGTRYDWENYLERIRDRRRVVSGASLERVLQTEQQALNNLERGRLMIYYSIPQVFHFYRISGGFGFKSEVGYSIYGKYGIYIPKNPASPNSYSEPSHAQTIQLLSSWNPDES